MEYNPKYPILNLDETGRFFNDDYKIPKGYNLSESTYDTIEEAEKALDDLKKQDNYSVSTFTSCLGTYIYKEHWVKIVYKIAHSFS